MEIVDVQEEKTQLSRLLERVSRGEEIIIARDGKPVAKLSPVVSRKPRRLGTMKGQIWVAPDFDAPLPDEVLDLFEGRRAP